MQANEVRSRRSGHGAVRVDGQRKAFITAPAEPDAEQREAVDEAARCALLASFSSNEKSPDDPRKSRFQIS